MFLAHSFRLRDPWQCEPAPGGGQRWTRVFHRPTGLEVDDQLVLVISGLPPGAEVTVNGAVPEGGPQFDLTGVLADSNRIELYIPAAACQPRPDVFPYDARLAVVGHS